MYIFQHINVLNGQLSSFFNFMLNKCIPLSMCLLLWEPFFSYFIWKRAAPFTSLSNPSKRCNWCILQNNRLPLVFLHDFSLRNGWFEHKALVCMFTEQSARSVWIYHTDQFLRIPARTCKLQKGQVMATLALKPSHSSSRSNSDCHLQVLQHRLMNWINCI